MNGLIRRPSIPKYVEPQTVSEAFENTIVPSWYWERRKINSYSYKQGYSLISILRDVQHEQLLWISKFNYEFLDITKPYYASIVDNASALIKRAATRISKSTDVLYDDIYKHGKRIQDLGELEESKLLGFLNNPNYPFEHITPDDIQNALDTQILYKNVLDQLLPGEQILSGRYLAPTTYGRLVSFGDAANSDPGFQQSNTINSGEVSGDSRYLLLPLLTIVSSLTYRVPGRPADTQLSFVPRIIARAGSTGRYSHTYDVDEDGYISNEDVSYLRSIIGKKIQDMSEREWLDNYSRFDLNKDGVITFSDVAFGIRAEGAVREASLIISNPVVGPAVVSFQYHQGPFITYYSESASTKGGTFEADEILTGTGMDARIKDGVVTSTSGISIGINITKNEIWGGRNTELGWTLRRVARPEPDIFLVRGIVEVDNAAFILVSTEDGDIATSGAYAGYSAAIVRIDLLREAIEFTDDIIPLANLELNSNEIPTGLIATSRKDIFRIATSDSRILTVRLGQNSVVKIGDQILASQDSDYPETARRRIYNDVDNFAFNVGVYRYLGETNEQLWKKIAASLKNPAGNDLQGMYRGYARMLGVFEPILAQMGSMLMVNTPDPSTIVIHVDDNGDNSFVLGAPVESTDVVDIRKTYLSSVVYSHTIDANSYTVHKYEDGSILIGNLLHLSMETMRRICIVKMKSKPATILQDNVIKPYEERLAQYPNTLIRVQYTAVDPDGRSHSGINEPHTVNVSSLDQLEAYIPTHNSVPGVKAIHPDSVLAGYLPTIYALVDPDIEFFIGRDRVNAIMADLEANDRSKWNTTEVGTAIYGEAYRSDNIIRKTNFNQNVFDEDLIEVEL